MHGVRDIADRCNGSVITDADATQTGLFEFPKTRLQDEGDDDVDAMLFFLEIRKKYEQSCQKRVAECGKALDEIDVIRPGIHYDSDYSSVERAGNKKSIFFKSMLVVLSDTTQKSKNVWPRTAEYS